MFASLMAGLHYFSLAIGFWALVERGRAFKGMRTGQVSSDLLRRLFFTDTVWGIAALLWIGTGLLRAFGSLEKGAAFYLANGFFHLKMGLFLMVFCLEIAPMALIIRWRLAKPKGQLPTISTAAPGRLLVVNHLEVIVLVMIVFVASLMARGVWLFGR